MLRLARCQKNRLIMLLESQMPSDTADTMRNVKGKEGVNSKHLVPVRGKMIQGDAIAAMVFMFCDVLGFQPFGFFWLSGALHRDSTRELYSWSESTRKQRSPRHRSWPDFCCQERGMVVWGNRLQCNSTRSWQPPAVKSWSWLDGVAYALWPQSATFWSWTFSRLFKRSNLAFSIQQNKDAKALVIYGF